ncbi:hypothetical protein Scep_014942 [Stephania cephalantha]|uniref:Uncharacterized protein n=1 Tax=Stephania cephalantha TaxID=152367 RepID=A0AAP0J247_9MAGN
MRLATPAAARPARRARPRGGRGGEHGGDRARHHQRRHARGRPRPRRRRREIWPGGGDRAARRPAHGSRRRRWLDDAGEQLRARGAAKAIASDGARARGDATQRGLDGGHGRGGGRRGLRSSRRPAEQHARAGGAAMRDGALSTARCAIRQNRDDAMETGSGVHVVLGRARPNFMGNWGRHSLDLGEVGIKQLEYIHLHKTAALGGDGGDSGWWGDEEVEMGGGGDGWRWRWVESVDCRDREREREKG